MKPQSPYAAELDRLTERALAAHNHAVELELTCGWTYRTRAAWREYRKALLALGRATSDALYNQRWLETRRKAG